MGPIEINNNSTIEQLNGDSDYTGGQLMSYSQSDRNVIPTVESEKQTIGQLMSIYGLSKNAVHEEDNMQTINQLMNHGQLKTDNLGENHNQTMHQPINCGQTKFTCPEENNILSIAQLMSYNNQSRNIISSSESNNQTIDGLRSKNQSNFSRSINDNNQTLTNNGDNNQSSNASPAANYNLNIDQLRIYSQSKNANPAQDLTFAQLMSNKKPINHAQENYQTIEQLMKEKLKETSPTEDDDLTTAQLMSYNQSRKASPSEQKNQNFDEFSDSQKSDKVKTKKKCPGCYGVTIENLDMEVDYRTLQSAFSKFGNVHKMKMKTIGSNVSSYKTGMVSYLDKKEMQAAAKGMNGKVIIKRRLYVYETPRKPTKTKSASGGDETKVLIYYTRYFITIP